MKTCGPALQLIRNATLTGIVALSAPLTAAADDSLSSELLSGSVHAIVGLDANISFSAGADGVFVVDTGGRRGARAALEIIDSVTDAPVRYLVNTHAHPANSGGNERFAKAGAVIVAHEEVRSVLAGNGADVSALPTFTLSELARISFEFNDETIHVFHVAPAHAPGNVMTHFTGSNVIHMGELFSPNHYPVLAGGTLSANIRALDAAVRVSNVDTLIVPSHGSVSDREGLIAYREMLIGVRERVIDALDQGQTLEQFLAMRPTQEFDAQYGDPSDPLFLPVVFEEFSLRRSPAGD